MASPETRSEGPGKRADLEIEALQATRAFVDRMRTLYRELERRTGAPVAVHRALTFIEQEPGIPASRLAEKLDMKRPNVSHLLKAMVESSWVERRRTNDDQRSVHLYLTSGGRSLLNATNGRVSGALHRAVGSMSQRDLEHLRRLMNGLLAGLPTPRPTPIAAALRRNPPRP